MPAHSRFGSYEEAVAAHKWRVPARYNIAEDVCDKHPPGKLAMLWEDFRGNGRQVRWGELQEASSRLASVLRQHDVEVGDRVAMLLTPRPETAAAFLGTFKAGAILLSLSVLYGDDGIRHRVTDAQARVLLTNAESAERVRALNLPVDHVLVLDDDLIAAGDPGFERVDTAADDPAQLYYTSGTTGLAKGILHAHRYLLGHNEFELCHDIQDGERFHGMGEWAWAAGIAPLLGPWRYGAVQVVYEREGGFDPHKQLAFLSKHRVTNVFGTPTAIRSMMAIDDAGTRYPQEFRIVCAAGEPLNPEAIRWFRRQYGVTVLDFYGLSESYPLCGNFPFMEVREGSMGRPVPGWDVAILDEDERPLPPGERGEICLRARSNPHYPLGYWNNEEAARETFGGEWFHTKDAARVDEDGYVWYEGRADDVIIAPGTGSGRSRSSRPVWSIPRWRRRQQWHRPTSDGATWSRRSSCWRRDTSRAKRPRRRSSSTSGLGSARTTIPAGSSSSPRSRRRSPARSGGSSCARPRHARCATRRRPRLRSRPAGQRSGRQLPTMSL
jgi:acetyl-CoA synthetase